VEGSKTIAEVLGPDAYVDTLRDNLVDTLSPLVAAFADSSELKAWLDA
jgi:hypothetical protein